MDKLELYRKRSKQLYYAFIAFTSFMFIACLGIYPYFKVPLAQSTVLRLSILTLLLGLLSTALALVLRRRAFPVKTSQDPYWSYTATRRYFWLFMLALLPYFFSFLVFVIFASIEVLLVGYSIGFFGLILLRPRKEDVV